MDEQPRVTYKRTVNLGNYESHTLEITTFAEKSSIEEVDSQIEYTMATVAAHLRRETLRIRKDRKEDKNTLVK